MLLLKNETCLQTAHGIMFVCVPSSLDYILWFSLPAVGLNRRGKYMVHWSLSSPWQHGSVGLTIFFLCAHGPACDRAPSLLDPYSHVIGQFKLMDAGRLSLAHYRWELKIRAIIVPWLFQHAAGESHGFHASPRTHILIYTFRGWDCIELQRFNQGRDHRG